MTIDRYLDAARTLNDSGRRYAVEATRTQWVGTIFASADGKTLSANIFGRLVSWPSTSTCACCLAETSSRTSGCPLCPNGAILCLQCADRHWQDPQREHGGEAR